MNYRQSILLVLAIMGATILQAQKRIVVALDGSGQYNSIQKAFDAIPLGNKKPITIFVKEGIYYEKLQLDSSKNGVRLVGADKFRTIITYNDHTGKIDPQGRTINTYTSQTFRILADDFTAENISFENNAGFSAGQAVSVQAAGDRLRFLNCRFLGFQDVLFAVSEKSRQYYQHCYIEGTTDFIFGAATAWFESCHIHSKKNSHVTAASTPKEKAFGFVFNDCVLTADSTLRGVSLGRPWQPYASVTYLNCYIDRHIIAQGWNNWNKPESERTARYNEWRSYGPGGSAEKRVPWSRQLTEAEARAINLKTVFPNWNPLK